MKPFTIAIALLIILAGCAQSPSGQTTSAKEIPIGAILILSGPGATWGTSSVNGAQMAIDEINSQGGVNGKQLKLIAEDTAGEPKKAIDAYHKLRNIDGTHIILGTTWTREGLPVAPLAAKDDVVMISPSLGVA